jgi:C4-type Zn-finger protein
MNDQYDCPRCSIGVCQPHRKSYTRIHSGHVVNMPITRYVCDVCSFAELDPEALQELFEVLGQTRLTTETEAEAAARKPKLSYAGRMARRKARDINT